MNDVDLEGRRRDVDPEGRRRDNMRRVEGAIRDWANRPPAIASPVARTRILARIGERRPRRGWLAAAAAMAVALAFGLLLRGTGTPHELPVEVAAAESSSGMLVYELESGTTLYMTLAVTTSFAKTTMEGDPR